MLAAAWPQAFSVSFITNVSSPEEKTHGIQGMLYFEEGKGQRVFHEGGSQEVQLNEKMFFWHV
jgi:hypothetical protein